MLCSQSTGLLQLHIQPCEIGFDPDLLTSVAMFISWDDTFRKAFGTENGPKPSLPSKTNGKLKQILSGLDEETLGKLQWHHFCAM